MNYSKIFLIYILLIGFSLESLGQSQPKSLTAQKGIPLAQQGLLAPGSSKSPSGRDRFESELDKALAPALKRLDQLPSEGVKAKGGIQDGSGGSEAESEMAQMMHDWSIRFYTFSSHLIRLQLLTQESWQKFATLFPRRSKELGICIYISEANAQAVCENDSARVQIPLSEWKALSADSKRFRALVEILRLIAVQSERSVDDSAFEISQVLSPRPSVMHRYDVVDRLENGTLVAVRNMNPAKRDLVKIEMVKGLRSTYHNIIVRQQDTGQTISYRVDPSEGYFNVDMCGDSFKEEVIADILSEQFQFNEFKPLVEKCQNLLNSGKPLTTFFVNSGLHLVLNCR